MKISLFITNLKIGGAEMVLLNMANELISRGYAVDVILIKANGELLKRLNPKIKIIDLNISRINRSLPGLIQYFKRNKPDYFIAFMWPLTIVALFSCFLAGLRQSTKIILAEHCTWTLSQFEASHKPRYIKFSMWLCYRFSHAVVTVSEGAKFDLIKFANLPIDKINLVSIYNPVLDLKPKKINLIENPKSWCEGTHQKILAVGNLKFIKDHQTLLKAFKILRCFKNAKLLILGEGEMRQELTTLIQELGLEEDCILFGQVQEPEAYYQLADLFVLSSKGEGLPTVLIEALSHGLNIVSTNCPSGPNEILADGKYGRLVPVGDEQQLAFEMINALDTPLEKKVLQERANFFSIPQAVDAYLELLEH